jgi:phosphopentomutase
MGGEVAVINVSEVIKDRIKAEFVRLIPEDAWQGLVDNCLTQFQFKERAGYGRDSEKPSELERMITQEIEVLAKNRIAEVLSTKATSGNWNDTTVMKAIEKSIQEYLTANFAVLMAGFVNQIAQGAISNALSNMNVQIQNRGY